MSRGYAKSGAGGASSGIPWPGNRWGALGGFGAAQRVYNERLTTQVSLAHHLDNANGASSRRAADRKRGGEL